MNKNNLTENEKRDILKYIESGKPLPEKYRFLLFEDKKELNDELHLVWLPVLESVCAYFLTAKGVYVTKLNAL